MAGLDQEEVWDDTALIDSWNEAFAEYKKYHSIADKGGKVSPPPKANSKGLTNGDRATANAEQPQVEAADQDDDDDDDDDEYDPSIGLASKSGQSTAGVASSSHAPSTAAAAPAEMPQVLAAGVQDDNMKNLMMSWYYAGYYTGLYEGKQQGYASALLQSGQTPRQSTQEGG